MPAVVIANRRVLPTAAFGLCLLLLLQHPAAWSSDAPAAPHPATKPHAEAPAAGGAAVVKPSAPERRSAAEPKSGADPLDQIRERLAARLGAIKAPDASSSNVVRVTARSGIAPSAGHDTIAITTAAAATQPSGGASSLAAAHRRSRAAPVAAPHAAALHHTGAAHWDYSDTGGKDSASTGGPASWGAMRAEFGTCSSGTRQSPIDIRDGIKVDLDPVRFDYRPSAFRVVDNGHTVQVNVDPGNSIEVMGRRYDLLQFHFHRPSEERINGRQFDMVAHLVHKGTDGRLAVVAVLLDRGSAQPIVQNVWNNLPLEKGQEVAARLPLDLNALLPPDRSYFTYMGSLTTPPCSEDVLWMVMKQAVPISPEQVAIFARLYPMNARPIQSASGRLIKESN